MMNYKDFNDLEFDTHPVMTSKLSTRASIFFDNGYGVSVITGSGAYASETEPYELAVLKGTADEFSLTYDTPITDDVLGYQTELDVTNAMLAVQALKEV